MHPSQRHPLCTKITHSVEEVSVAKWLRIRIPTGPLDSFMWGNCLAYETSVALLRCPFLPWKGIWGLPPPEKLERCHMRTQLYLLRQQKGVNCHVVYIIAYIQTWNEINCDVIDMSLLQYSMYFPELYSSNFCCLCWTV
jgi:hypothetical protein